MQNYVTEHSIPVWRRSKDSLSSPYYLNTHCKGQTILSHKTTMLQYCTIKLISQLDVATNVPIISATLIGKLNKKKQQTSNTKTSEVITNYKFMLIILQPLFRILQT